MESSPALQTYRFGKTSSHGGGDPTNIAAFHAAWSRRAWSAANVTGPPLWSRSRHCPGVSTPGQKGSEPAAVHTPGTCLWLSRVTHALVHICSLGLAKGQNICLGNPTKVQAWAKTTKALVALQQKKFNCDTITRKAPVLLRPGSFLPHLLGFLYGTGSPFSLSPGAQAEGSTALLREACVFKFSPQQMQDFFLIFKKK